MLPSEGHEGGPDTCKAEALNGHVLESVDVAASKEDPAQTDPFWQEEVEPNVEGPKPKDIITPSSTKVANYELFLSWTAISIAAYAGAYIRVGLSSWKIWNMDTDMTSIYAQILGCFLMGFVTHHKNYFFNTSSRCIRVIYLGITSGLCGSITTFSTLNVLCNQACFFDSALISGPNITGARMAAWAVCLWVGIAISLKSLHLGHYLALLSPNSNTRLPSTTTPSSPLPFTETAMEAALILTYLAITGLVLALPSAMGRPDLAYTAAFGACGAFLRFLLSLHNPRIRHFPIGTFAANVFSTWVLAGVTAVRGLPGATAGGGGADGRPALVGIAYGFCGCLSTISTFVNEMDSLPAGAAVAYGLATFAAAHLGVLLCYDVPLFALPGARTS